MSVWTAIAARFNLHAAAIDDLDEVKGEHISETALGVWTRDAPARVNGLPPVAFYGVSDPADPTNGVATPANIGQYDEWHEMSSLP